MPNSAHVSIALVKDDKGHARQVEKDLIRARVINDLIVLIDGQQAVDHLARQGANADCALVGSLVVLLDLNLPVLDAYQVLGRFKAGRRARHNPLVILTATADPRKVARCRDLGRVIYVTKPQDYARFCGAIQKLGLFLSTATMPGEEESDFCVERRGGAP